MAKRFFKKKRAYKKKRFAKYKKRSMGIPRGVSGQGMPRNFFTKLKITAFKNEATGTLANNTLLMNSLYDPLSSWFGTQPLQFDEIAAFYWRYRVNACVIKCYIVNNSSSQRFRASLYCDNISGGPATMDAAMQQRECKWAHFAVNSQNGSTRVLKSTVKTKRRFTP